VTQPIPPPHRAGIRAEKGGKKKKEGNERKDKMKQAASVEFRVSHSPKKGKWGGGRGEDGRKLRGTVLPTPNPSLQKKGEKRGKQPKAALPRLILLAWPIPQKKEGKKKKKKKKRKKGGRGQRGQFMTLELWMLVFLYF